MSYGRHVRYPEWFPLSIFFPLLSLFGFFCMGGFPLTPGAFLALCHGSHSASFSLGVFFSFSFSLQSVFLLLFCMGAFTPSSPLCEVSHSLETSLFIFLPRLRLEVMGIFVSHHLPLWQYRFFSIGIQRVDNPFCFSYGNDPM